jgi:hypothetical protein
MLFTKACSEAHVYSEEEPGRRSAAKVLTKDEAWWIATREEAQRGEKSLPWHGAVHPCAGHGTPVCYAIAKGPAY